MYEGVWCATLLVSSVNKRYADGTAVGDVDATRHGWYPRLNKQPQSDDHNTARTCMRPKNETTAENEDILYVGKGHKEEEGPGVRRRRRSEGVPIHHHNEPPRVCPRTYMREVHPSGGKRSGARVG